MGVQRSLWSKIFFFKRSVSTTGSNNLFAHQKIWARMCIVHWKKKFEDILKNAREIVSTIKPFWTIWLFLGVSRYHLIFLKIGSYFTSLIFRVLKKVGISVTIIINFVKVYLNRKWLKSIKNVALLRANHKN